MLPTLALLGLVKVWFIVLPLLALAPVIEPVLVPNVQANVLAVLAVKVKFGLVPLQMVAVFELVKFGVFILINTQFEVSGLVVPNLEILLHSLY
jgi:hypothetical protein